MRAVAVALAAFATVALLTACGGGGSQPAGSIAVKMTEFSYSPDTISVPAGKTTFWLVNSGSAAHDLIIRDSNNNRVAASELIQAGNSEGFPGGNPAARQYTVSCHPARREPSRTK